MIPLLPGKGKSSGWLVGALRQQRPALRRVLVASIFINLLGIFYALFVMALFNRVLPGGSMSSLVALGAGMLLILLFEWLLRRIRGVLIDHAAATIDRELGRQLMQRIFSIGSSGIPRFTGERAMLFRDYEILRELASSATISVMADMPFVVVYLATVFAIGGWIGLVPVGVALLVALIAGRAISAVGALDEEQQLAGQSRQAALVEALSAIDSAKATGGAHLLVRRWGMALDRQTAMVFHQRKIANDAIVASTVGQSFAYASTMLVGAILVGDSTLTMGALVAMGLLTGRAMAPLVQLMALLVRARHGMAALSRLSSVFGAETPPTHQASIDMPACSISFRNVCFTWPGAASPALKDLSFSIAAGERVALVGRVGAGKSSVMALLLGLFSPQSGSILVNGTPLQDLDIDALRQRTGYSPQDAALFSGTVAENLDPWARDPDETRLLNALHMVGLDAGLLPVSLGERGEGLSGGQRQMVSLARALARPVSLLLLDEPGSGLDLKSERDFLAKLAAARLPSTLIIATHRPAMLALVDRIIVLEDGVICRDGARDEVLDISRPGNPS